MTDQAKQSIGDAANQAQQTAGQMAQQVQQQAGQVVNQARDQAVSQLSAQKDKAAEGLGSVADALRQTSQGLRKNEQDPFADFFDQAASQVDRFSDQLQRRDVTEIMGDVERFARNQPALFLAGAFALGLVAARFLKSSGEAMDASGGNPNWRGNYQPGYGPGYQGYQGNQGGWRPGYNAYPPNYSRRRQSYGTSAGYSTRPTGYSAGNYQGSGAGSSFYGRVEPERVEGGITGTPGTTRTPTYTQKNPQATTSDPSAYEPSTRTSHLTGREEK